MIIVALMVPVALGFTALAVEGGLWYADHHQLRSVADAAGLAAGWARREGLDETDAAFAAVPPIGFKAAIDDLEVISPPATGAFAGDPQAIEIIAHRSRDIIMSKLFRSGSAIDIRARAVVQMGTKSGVCVLALDPHAGGALKVQGTADIDFNGCGVNVNSNAAGALDLGGGALLNVDWADVTGGIVANGGGTLVSSQAPKTKMPPRPDPYAGLTMPPASACTATNLHVQNMWWGSQYATTWTRWLEYQVAALTQPTVMNDASPPQSPHLTQLAAAGGGGGSTTTLNPGRYCGGITFGSNAVAVLTPGTYVIDGGSFSVAGGAQITGDGVTIILTGSGADYATVTINGGATVSLSAPTTGDYAGVAFMQDRNAPTNGSDKFNGGSTMNVDGIIYIPRQEVQFTGGNTTGNRCTRIVADIITFSGNANLNNDCSHLGIPEEVDDDPRLVE